MDIVLLVKGFILGFSIAAPVGPIGVLCIRRTLTKGMLNGFAAGLGAATADAFYGSVAAFGLTVITNFLLEYNLFLHMAGSVFLFYLGYTTFIAKPAAQRQNVYHDGMAKAYFSTFLLTITNPLTILSFVAVFAGLGAIGTRGGYVSSGLLVAGVFAGSSVWWLILSGTIHIVRSKFDAKHLTWINQLSGIVILGFGITSLLALL